MQPFEIDLPISNLNNRNERSRFSRDTGTFGRFMSRGLQPRNRELYPRFDNSEFRSRIAVPMELFPTIVRNEGLNNNDNNNNNNNSNNIYRTNSNNSRSDNEINNNYNSNSLNLNVENIIRNASRLEPVLEEFNSINDFNYVSSIEDLNREAISGSPAKYYTNNISNINISNSNVSNNIENSTSKYFCLF